MIGAASSDHLLPLRLAFVVVILTSDLERGFNGLGSTLAEKCGGLVAGRNFTEAGGELDRRDSGCLRGTCLG